MPDDAHRLREDLLVHAGFVRGRARAALRGDADCEDLEQDVWRAALAGAPVEVERQRPWLVTVLRRRAADFLRGRGRRARRERAAARPETVASTADAVERAETGRRLVAAVLALEEPFRSAVLLRFQDGLPPRAVAERLGVPVETARSRIRRGLERLRADLSERERREGRDARRVLSGLVVGVGGGAGSLALLGGALVAKKLVGVAALLLLALGAFAVWRPDLPSRDAPPDASPARALVADRRGDSPPTATLEVAAQPPRDPAPVAKEAPAAVQATVRGRVVGEDGTPIAGAVLRPSSPGHDVTGSGLMAEDDVGASHSVRSDAEGRFELPIPAAPPYNPGGMHVHVEARGWCLPVELSGPPVAYLKAGIESTVTLKRGVRFDVRVLDGVTGGPIPAATVAIYLNRAQLLYMEQPLVEEATDGDGRASVAVAGGEIRAVARKAGYAEAEAEGVVVGPEGASVTIRLHPGATVEVSVTDLAGRPVPGARVALLRAPSVHTRGVADASGLATFPHVPPAGTSRPDGAALRLVLVAAEAEGLARAWQAAEAPREGETLSMRVALARPRTLLGRLRSADGAPAARRNVVASTRQGNLEWGWSGTGPFTAGVLTGEDGTFELAGIAPGEVRVRVSSTGPVFSPPTTVTVRVPAEGEIAPVEVVLPAETPSVDVLVVDSSGRGVKDAQVSLYPENDSDGRRSLAGFLTNSEGRVTVRPGGPAPWWLFVDASGAGPLVRRVEAAEAASGPVRAGPGPGSIEGHAVRLDGSPARVRLALRTTLRLSSVNHLRTAYNGAVDSAADGRFAFEGVHDGVESIVSVTPGLAVLAPSGALASSRVRDQRVVVIDDSEAAGLNVEAEVTDEDGRPIAGARVELSRDRGSGYGSLRIDPGKPTVHRSSQPLEPGTWHVRAGAEGYEPREAEATVSPGGVPPRVRFLLRRKP